MLTSESRAFVFVHIQKTAGTALTRDLRAQVPDAVKLGHTHDTARDAIALIGREAWDRAYTFAFVRNPWDRLVSWWSMIEAHRPRVPLYRYFDRAKPRPRLWRCALDTARTFDEFVLRCTDEIDDPQLGPKSFTRPQADYLTDEAGEPCLRFVGRFESLQADYDHVRQHLGLEPRELTRSRNRSVHEHYSRYYTDQTRDLVAERFRADLDRFGYTFEDRRGTPKEAPQETPPAR